MTRPIIILLALTGILMSCSKTGELQFREEEQVQHQQLPKALFITTGISNENTQLPNGIVLAIQGLNKQGVPVRLESRNILYHEALLNQYNILILSTSVGYHDADRQYSLTYMTQEEVRNIERFVKQGGVLIAGDNVGRNRMDGTDRITIHDRLTPENFPLAKCFGTSFTEQNLAGYNIKGKIGDYFRGTFFRDTGTYLWTLTPDSIISNNAKVLAHWTKEDQKIPAMIKNRYQQGTAYLLPISDFLHPARKGGLWSAQQIMDFYDYVVQDLYHSNDLNVHLNPWPRGYEYAFCTSFNCKGDQSEYQRVFDLLKKEKLRPVFFVNGKLEQNIQTMLKNADISLASSGFAYDNYRRMNYPMAVSDILRNEQLWNKDFKGFRFPFTKPDFWGLFALDENGYSYESSIGANNIEFFKGSVFPHNLVISTNQLYRTTDILEVAPTYHDDYYFFKFLTEQQQANPQNLKKQVALYQKYLLNYWEKAVKPYSGLMIFLGHPAYVGYNDTTLQCLDTLVSVVKNDPTWITSMNNMVAFRKKLHQFEYCSYRQDNRIIIQAEGPADQMVKNTTFTLDQKPLEATARYGNVAIEHSKNQVIFNTSDQQVVSIRVGD